MSDNSGGWLETVLRAFFDHPEKSALFIVLFAGIWRWIRELIREWRGDIHEETLMESLLRENRELRAELHRYRSNALNPIEQSRNQDELS